MSAPGPGGAAGASRAPRRIYVTDCEGPLTKNDNAQEIAERFIPDGAEFFARLSKYDDFLADVVRRPGYNAGDTLRLLPPFLKAFAVTDEDVEAFSAEGVLLVPGALRGADRDRRTACRPSSSRRRTRRTSGRCAGSRRFPWRTCAARS